MQHHSGTGYKLTLLTLPAMDRNNIPTQLLSDIKNYLNITWDDTATDNKLNTMIASGMSYLDGKGGGTLDYESDGTPRTLLFEYVRYMRSNALDVFENNYTALILNMQAERLVADGETVESTTPTG